MSTKSNSRGTVLDSRRSATNKIQYGGNDGNTFSPASAWTGGELQQFTKAPKQNVIPVSSSSSTEDSQRGYSTVVGGGASRRTASKKSSRAKSIASRRSGAEYSYITDDSDDDDDDEDEDSDDVIPEESEESSVCDCDDDSDDDEEDSYDNEDNDDYDDDEEEDDDVQSGGGAELRSRSKSSTKSSSKSSKKSSKSVKEPDSTALDSLNESLVAPNLVRNKSQKVIDQFKKNFLSLVDDNIDEFDRIHVPRITTKNVKLATKILNFLGSKNRTYSSLNHDTFIQAFEKATDSYYKSPEDLILLDQCFKLYLHEQGGVASLKKAIENYENERASSDNKRDELIYKDYFIYRTDIPKKDTRRISGDALDSSISNKDDDKKYEWKLKKGLISDYNAVILNNIQNLCKEFGRESSYTAEIWDNYKTLWNSKLSSNPSYVLEQWYEMPCNQVGDIFKGLYHEHQSITTFSPISVLTLAGGIKAFHEPACQANYATLVTTNNTLIPSHNCYAELLWRDKMLTVRNKNRDIMTQKYKDETGLNFPPSEWIFNDIKQRIMAQYLIRDNFNIFSQTGPRWSTNSSGSSIAGWPMDQMLSILGAKDNIDMDLTTPTANMERFLSLLQINQGYRNRCHCPYR